MKEKNIISVDKQVIYRANEVIEEMLVVMAEMKLTERLDKGGIITFGEGQMRVRKYLEGNRSGWEVQLEEENEWLRTDNKGKINQLVSQKEVDMAKKLGELDIF